ncbi:uncharacterized protein LOC131239709 [Magnolia sinica]|uniref:uncharacterized protein LOC131239709 n=1 Tax=Magnolia sinica TaxID=86752 RepID=UPI00265A4514|nr:uncharacterized protein LOC131239709 [Magnolia sinica]
MEDYKRSQIPAFGYWDFSDDLPITQYFESAAQAGLIRFNNITGESDLYGYDLKRPTAATVHRPKMKENSKSHMQHVSKEQRKQGRVCDVTEPPKQPRAPKAVDEDLYKIPPELLHEKPKRKRVMGFWSSCLAPSCIA